jgi:signal transduction histidine kinase/DNA-binding response OmpR family regulator
MDGVTGFSAPTVGSLRWRMLLVWFGLSGTVLLVCYGLYRRDANQIEQSTREREVLRVALLSRFFAQGLRGIAEDVRVVSQSESLRSYLEDGQKAQLNLLAREMLHLGSQHPEYDSIRYIDAQGREQARVDRNRGIVPASDLLDKGQRRFFLQAMQLGPGQLHISALDLNQYSGVVEQPPKPTILFAEPIFDAAGRRRGVVVINYLGAYLLDNLKQLSTANQHRLRVLSSQGYWLHAANPDDEWGAQLPGKADRTLARSAPELWQEMMKAPDGQVPFRGGWFTWQRIMPDATVADAQSEDPFLIVASEFSAAERAAELVDRRQAVLFVTVIMLIVTAGAGWFFYARQRERQNTEAALRLASASAQESTRLKAQFLANMSHEIRTPMNGVIGMVGLLIDTPLTAEQRSLAEVVRTSAESLLTIINDVLDFSKIEAGQLAFEHTPFNLSDPVENCLTLLAERAHEKGLELAYLIEENVPMQLMGDAGRLHQVLLNLVGNALKFTEHGEVVLRVARQSEENRRVRLRFTIRDTGVGIAPEARARLFQPFTQADSSTTRRFGGTGLGLAICRQLVSLMGGEIGLDSVPSQGTTFWFTAEFALQDSVPKVVLRRAELAGLRALIVDDNETNREILLRQLATWQISARTAAGGEEALATLRAAVAAQEPFQLAVLDMQMPGMSGLDLARQVQADPALTGTRMIILSSIGNSLLRSDLAAAGVGAALTKPARQAQLHEALLNLMASRPAPTVGAAPPARVAPAEIPLPPPAPASDLKLRILVAEDNLVNQQVALLQLQRFGYQPEIVGSGRQAVAAVTSRLYDVILMDCQMPDVDGFEAARRIRAWEAEQQVKGVALVPLHIIAMTANAMVGDRESCFAAGMNDYVTKPVRATDLAAALARAQVPTA